MGCARIARSLDGAKHQYIFSRDPDEDPATLLFYSAQISSIPGIEKAIEKDPSIIYASDVFDRRSALHMAAASRKPDAMNAVRWLLQKGIPWSAQDNDCHIPEDFARMSGHDELREFLREWAVKKGEDVL